MNALERTADWHQANQRVLAAGINAVRQVLELVAHDPADPSAIGLVDAAIVEAEASMPLPSSLNELVSRFGLTSFERDLILLCAGMELDPAVTAAWQQATGIPGAVLPTFGVALEVLPSAHWSAMTPGSVLRRARLLALGQGPTLGTRPLRIEEPVLHFLNGLPELDARLDGVVTPHRDRLPMATFQQIAARRIVAKLSATRNAGGAWPVVTLRYTHGFKGIAGSDFDYDKLRLSVHKRVRYGPAGVGYVTLTGEYVFSRLPYPLLSLHLGNQTPFFAHVTYNLMDYGEFVSDRFAALHYSHHFEGLLLNRIPLMRKLKWRLVGTANVIMGGMSSMNRALIPEETSDDTRAIGFLSRGVPYIELGYGIENILKFFRVDFIHRVTYTDKAQNPDVRTFGVLFSFQFNL